jgi:hypothetical protein
LPESAQAKVLDFVRFLKSRTGADDAESSAMSLEQAVRRMETEPDLYSDSDLKEHFE